jgi:hypothetical protein
MEGIITLWAATSGLPTWLIILNVAAFIIAAICFFNWATKASGITLLLAAIADWFVLGTPLAWFIAHWQVTVGAIAVYALVGVIWGVVRWFIYLNSADTKTTIKNAFSLYNTYYSNLKEGETKPSFKESNYYPFSFRKDSSMITTWIVFWPLSIIWTFFSEFITRLFDHVWNFFKWIGKSFAKVYANMAEKTVDNVLKDK